MSELDEPQQPTVQSTRPRLGDILREKFHLSELKLEEALAYQQEKGGRLGEVLLHLRVLREELVSEALAQQFDMTWIPHLDSTPVDSDMIKKVPIAFCRRYRVLPLRAETDPSSPPRPIRWKPWPWMTFACSWENPSRPS